MPRYHLDDVSRLEDIEGLLTTAQGFTSRFSDDELQVTKDCLRSALFELRAARKKLIAKWRDQDSA